ATTHGHLKSLRSGRIVVQEPAAILRVEGPGALECLQGLLTNDLAVAGEASVVYGALLTSKGMIVVDPWVLRQSDRLTLVMDRAGREPAVQLLRRVLPPRLARVTDLSDQWSAAWVLGVCGLERLTRAGGAPQPGPGRVVEGAHRELLFGGGPAPAPFSGV